VHHEFDIVSTTWSITSSAPFFMSETIPLPAAIAGLSTWIFRILSIWQIGPFRPETPLLTTPQPLAQVREVTLPSYGMTRKSVVPRMELQGVSKIIAPFFIPLRFDDGSGTPGVWHQVVTESTSTKNSQNLVRTPPS